VVEAVEYPVPHEFEATAGRLELVPGAARQPVRDARYLRVIAVDDGRRDDKYSRVRAVQAAPPLPLMSPSSR